MKITMEGKYQTRDGRVVRLLATDFKAGAICVIGTITLTDDNEIVGLWSADGRVFPWGSPNNPDDLVPVPVKQDTWGIVNKDGKLVIYYSGDGAWYKAGLYQDTFKGDRVVRLTLDD